MISESISTLVNETVFSEDSLNRGSWTIILHANRIPPHVGMMFNGNYNSLTIKNRELNIRSEVLIKTIQQKKIKTIFLKLKQHPVFSTDHQLEMFQESLSLFTSVKQHEATCLTPVKLYLNEFYSLNLREDDLLYHTVQQLGCNNFIENATALNMDLKGKIDLPLYSIQELNELIANERKQFHKD